MSAKMLACEKLDCERVIGCVHVPTPGYLKYLGNLLIVNGGSHVWERGTPSVVEGLAPG